MERVNHPSHYNSHPSGIECISVIRHYVYDIGCAVKYLGRAGLKKEQGQADRQKEAEDLRKALWYIEDYKGYCRTDIEGNAISSAGCTSELVRQLTGHSIAAITEGYDQNVQQALMCLLRVGIIHNQDVWVDRKWRSLLHTAATAIRTRVCALEQTEVDHKEAGCRI